MCAVWLSFPLWVHKKGDADSEKKMPLANTASRSVPSFRYANGPQEKADRNPLSRNDPHQLQRQLARRAYMENSGFVKNIIENDSMPQEVRSRFSEEKQRLDKLAEEYPEEALKAGNVPVQNQLDENRNFTPEFEIAVDIMRQTGAWDSQHREFLRQLEKAAQDSSIPPEERPSREFINQVRSGEYIPSL